MVRYVGMYAGPSYGRDGYIWLSDKAESENNILIGEWFGKKVYLNWDCKDNEEVRWWIEASNLVEGIKGLLDRLEDESRKEFGSAIETVMYRDFIEKVFENIILGKKSRRSRYAMNLFLFHRYSEFYNMNIVEYIRSLRRIKKGEFSLDISELEREVEDILSSYGYEIEVKIDSDPNMLKIGVRDYSTYFLNSEEIWDKTSYEIRAGRYAYSLSLIYSDIVNKFKRILNNDIKYFYLVYFSKRLVTKIYRYSYNNFLSVVYFLVDYFETIYKEKDKILKEDIDRAEELLIDNLPRMIVEGKLERVSSPMYERMVEEMVESLLPVSVGIKAIKYRDVREALESGVDIVICKVGPLVAPKLNQFYYGVVFIIKDSISYMVEDEIEKSFEGVRVTKRRGYITFEGKKYLVLSYYYYYRMKKKSFEELTNMWNIVNDMIIPLILEYDLRYAIVESMDMIYNIKYLREKLSKRLMR